VLGKRYKTVDSIQYTVVSKKQKPKQSLTEAQRTQREQREDKERTKRRQREDKEKTKRRQREDKEKTKRGRTEPFQVISRLAVNDWAIKFKS